MNINPRKLLVKLFDLLKYESQLVLEVYTHKPEIDEQALYRIHKQGRYIINDEILVNNAQSFLKQINYEIIQGLYLNRRDVQINSLVIFECDARNCYDYLRYNKKMLNKEFESSESRAKILGHPEMLRQEGFFKQLDFGGKKAYKLVKIDINYLKK